MSLKEKDFVWFPYNEYVRLDGIIESIKDGVARIIFPDTHYDMDLRVEHAKVDECEKISNTAHIDHIKKLFERKGYAP